MQGSEVIRNPGLLLPPNLAALLTVFEMGAVLCYSHGSSHGHCITTNLSEIAYKIAVQSWHCTDMEVEERVSRSHWLYAIGLDLDKHVKLLSRQLDNSTELRYETCTAGK